MPIDTFEIRPSIKSVEKDIIETQNEAPDESPEELVNEDEYEEVTIPQQVVKEKIQRILFDANDIEFGDVINVEEYINIDKDKYRFNIETQTNDLLEEMVSTIPSAKRTNNVLNNIHTMITRFLQLRQIASKFDDNNNISEIIRKTAEDRPLAEYLSDFKNNLYWILNVATNIKKVYPSNAGTQYKRFGDYETINENEMLLQMNTLFKNYKSNVSIEGQNKYSHLYYSLDPYMTPFYSVNPDEGGDIFNVSNGIIIEADVQSNLNAIVDNLSNLYSTVVNNSEITNRRFIVQKYNLGLTRLQASNFKGPKMISHTVKLTNNDPISINGMVTLPEPTVRFSQINLPGTNLLVRSNLNLHFLDYWQLLKQKTNITNVLIDGLDNELEYDDANFVDNIKKYMLDLSDYERPKELTNLDIYKIFLRTIIPKIRVLFSLVKKYIKGRLSLIDVVNYLEPFLIYPIDLTYKQYNEINTFIREKIKEYNRIYKEYNMAFSAIKYLRSAKRKQSDDNNLYIYSNPLFSILETDRTINLAVMNAYGFDNPDQMTCSGSEFLKKTIIDDYGNLYNTAVALTNIKLMFPKELSSVFETDKDRLQKIIENDNKKDKCNTYIIAKKYYELDQLMQDNNKDIYFDKDYDNTNYNLIDEKYKKERDELNKEDFAILLEEDLKNKYKQDENTAIYMAESLLNQAKKVRNGQYALLVNSEGEIPAGIEYYIRKNDEWVLAKEVDPKWFIQDDDVLCNMEYSCIYNTNKKDDDKCVSTEISKDTVISNALKDVLAQFDKNYDISKEQLQLQLNKHFKYFTDIFNKLSELRRKQFYKYNDQKYNLGKEIADEISKKVVSPYIRLRDLIVGQNDFVKRQTDIVRFVTIYCREGNADTPNIHDGEMEDEWWYYCKQTDTKLIPAFRYYLAIAFLKGTQQYEDELDRLKKLIGKLGDDGDAWVDEHSGEVICYVDFDVSEGYKDGFVDKSRDILEMDAGEVLQHKQQEKQSQKQNQSQKRLSPEGQIVSNLVTILSSNMGIDIEQSRDFIIKIVTELMADTKILEKEPAYKKREKEAEKKGKKIPSYTLVYSSTLLYLTLGMYLIAIQTSIPSIKTRKTFPGCVRSFSGFPLEGEGDDTGLNYVACIAFKTKDPGVVPWNALAKNEEKIASTIKQFILRYLLPLSEVEQSIKDKVEYLLYSDSELLEDIPYEHSLGKWMNFLPPLTRFHVNKLNNVTDGFTEELQNDLYTGNPKQLEKLLVLDSKIIAYSLAIQEAIQKLVEKKDLLLKGSGQPFMDNACCNEMNNNTVSTLKYFINEDNNIGIYNKIVSDLTAIVRDIKILTQSAIMLSEVNTKRIFPEIKNDFSEETIYYAFIILCKFQNSVPLMEDIISICNDKPNYLKKSDTIQEKITKLKRDGRNYSKDKFLQLFQIVSRNNIIKMSLSFTNPSYTDGLKIVLDMLDRENNETIPKALTQKLELLLDVHDVTIEEDTKEMRSLKNYLSTSVDIMRKDVIEFIQLKSKINGNELRKLTKFLNEISNWNFDNDRNSGIKISDDAMYNNINFFKNFISLFAVVLPTMIVNQKIQTFEPPKYWTKINSEHINEIKADVSSFYKPLEKFYGNNTIKNVLYEIKSKCYGIYLLSNNTPATTNIKIGDKEIYSVFEKRTANLLFEYYFFSILSEYVNITKDPSLVTKLLVSSNKEEEEGDTYNYDYLIEQQLRFTETEQEFIEGDVSRLKQDVSKLLVGFLQIMMNTKKSLNVSFEDIEDRIFKLKEAEKYDFTDRLRDMSDEQRAVDTILKHHKLGPIYSIGLSKGIKEYDSNNFEHDKKVAQKVAEIQKRLNKNRQSNVDDMDIEDAMQEAQTEQEINMDLAMDMNQTDDYDDGDPWGEEMGNEIDYD